MRTLQPLRWFSLQKNPAGGRPQAFEFGRVPSTNSPAGQLWTKVAINALSTWTSPLESFPTPHSIDLPIYIHTWLGRLEGF